jgi:Asp-tRNA(Asn)/Glu-tRNA(Gln) amidotransferase A subunit family amidase
MDLSTQGPMATSIADLRLLLEVMRGPVHGDPTAIPSWKPRGSSKPSRVLAAPRTWDFGPLPPEVDEPLRAALAALEADLGLHVEEVSPADLFPSVAGTEHTPGDDWFTMVAAEELGWLGRAFVLEHMEDFSAPFRPAMEAALQIPLDDYLGARRRRFGYVRDTDTLLGEDAVLVTPTLGYAGWLADGTVPETGEPAGAEGYNNGEANLTGHPSLSVPAGTCANGLPFGLQITGPRFRDDLVLEVGAMWERARPWPLAAPGYEAFGAGIVG